jgi:hypothetical protein
VHITKKAGLIGVGALMLMCGAGIGMSAEPADATPASVMAQNWTPRATPQDGGYTPYWPLFRGMSVTMGCWTGGPYVDGTGKWFRIRSNEYPFQSGGFVPANAVARQAIVGHC